MIKLKTEKGQYTCSFSIHPNHPAYLTVQVLVRDVAKLSLGFKTFCFQGDHDSENNLFLHVIATNVYFT